MDALAQCHESIKTGNHIYGILVCMKTTIDIPDELFREAKVHAALEGIKLKDLITDALRQKLRATPKRRHHRAKFPLIDGDPTAPPITVEMVQTALEQMEREEDEAHGNSMRR